MQLSIGTLCINVIMKGQHCDPAITGIVINVPSRGSIGELKLLRMDFVVGIKEFLENLRRHGNAT